MSATVGSAPALPNSTAVSSSDLTEASIAASRAEAPFTSRPITSANRGSGSRAFQDSSSSEGRGSRMRVRMECWPQR